MGAILVIEEQKTAAGSAPSADPVFFRTYSRRDADGVRELWEQTCDRAVDGLVKIGRLTDEEQTLIRKAAKAKHAMPSGRWLWVGGTPWIDQPENFSGGYNCTSTAVVDWRAFGLMMDLAMMGCGTGAVLEDWAISQLPIILNYLEVKVVGMPGESADRPSGTVIEESVEQRGDGGQTCIIKIRVGDSRQGWVAAYQGLIELASDRRLQQFGTVKVEVNLSHVRPSGEPLKGFGGVANPAKLPKLWGRIAKILNGAIGRNLTAIECCLLIDEAAVVIVAGNVRRCLPEDSLVHTEKGLVPIKDVQVGDMVQTPKGFKKVVNKFDQGEQNVYGIESDWKPARATINHKYAVFRGFDNKGELCIEWTRLGDLIKGDRLVTDPRVALDFAAFQGLGSVNSLLTWDIEVENEHCFYADGYLVHNSAGLRQFDSTDTQAAAAKDNLWQQGEDGSWNIDPERDALRMANHTRVFHRKPTQDELRAAVRKQFYSGEGAIQYAPEALARANADLWRTDTQHSPVIASKREFLELTQEMMAPELLQAKLPNETPQQIMHRLQRYGLNPLTLAA